MITQFPLWSSAFLWPIIAMSPSYIAILPQARDHEGMQKCWLKGHSIQLWCCVRRSAARGAQEGDPAPRYPESMCYGWVPAFSMASATESYAALACMRGSEAVLMRGAPLVASLTSSWSLRHVVSCPVLAPTLHSVPHRSHILSTG